jgi:hypothetical protein
MESACTSNEWFLGISQNDRDRFPFIELEQGKLEENIVIGEGHSGLYSL